VVKSRLIVQEFQLRNTGNEMVSLYETLRDNTVLLVFIRGTW